MTTKTSLLTPVLLCVCSVVVGGARDCDLSHSTVVFVVQMKELDGKTILQLGAGGQHTVVLATDADVNVVRRAPTRKSMRTPSKKRQRMATPKTK